SVPAAGDWVTVTVVQLSVAVTPPVKSGTAAWQLLLAFAVRLLPHIVIFGGVISLTVKVLVQVLAFSATSFAVSVTVVTPVPTSVPAAGDCVTVTVVQLSVATTAPVKSGTAA